MIESHDLTGYTVYVGKYTMCRISNGTNKTVFVKDQLKRQDQERLMKTKTNKGSNN